MWTRKTGAAKVAAPPNEAAKNEIDDDCLVCRVRQIGMSVLLSIPLLLCSSRRKQLNRYRVEKRVVDQLVKAGHDAAGNVRECAG